MKDYITYCANTDDLVKELKEKYPHRVTVDEHGNSHFHITKSRIIRNKNETLALVRDREDLEFILNDLDSIVVLGTYEEIFADKEKRKIYNRVYKRPKGSPDKFAVFAD